MRVLDFLAGFLVCGALAYLVLGFVIGHINNLLRAANKRHDELEGNLDAMRWQLDRANRALLKYSPRRAPNGRFVKRSAS